MSTPLLRIHDLRAGYGRAEVLHGIDLQAGEGSVVTVIGPNGAGKSTLLNALMGVLPAKGSIEFRGQPIGGLSLEERVMLGIALVPEKRELFATMPVEDNLVLGAFRQVRLRNREWRDQIEQVYALFPRLKERRAQLAGTLSGGERQMLAVGRALMSEPQLLMLDEPSLGLAPAIVDTMYDSFAALHKEGQTILLAEQSVDLALEAAQHAYVLQVGRTVLEGPAQAMADNSDVQRIYLGVE